MNIDLVTWLFQIANFLILCGILWKFLFKPVTGLLDRRREEIQKRFDEAEGREKEASQAKEAIEEERRALEEERGRILSAARKELTD